MSKYKANRNHYQVTNYYEYPGRVGVASRSYHDNYNDASMAAKTSMKRYQSHGDNEVRYYYDIDKLFGRLKNKVFKFKK